MSEHRNRIFALAHLAAAIAAIAGGGAIGWWAGTAYGPLGGLIAIPAAIVIAMACALMLTALYEHI